MVRIDDEVHPLCHWLLSSLAVLLNGALPLDILATIIDEFIQRKKKEM